ncbi:MAG: AsnC family protein [Saprospiraceae bacterium]
MSTLSHNPSISNKEIANEVNLSVEGVSSSLRRMYSTFGIGSASSNKKVALLLEAIRLSQDEPENN